MRLATLALVLILAVPMPATAQRTEPLDRRVDRIEKELHAVQRKVFPGGAGLTLEPEINSQQPWSGPSGVPASSAVADLTGRVDALENQLRILTGQTEENAHRLRQLEQAMAQLKSDTEARLNAATPAPVRVAEPPAPSRTPPANDTAPTAGSAADPGEAAYSAGFRQWNAGQFADAQKTLDAMVKKYPKHSKISFAQNLLGRAYLDGNKPATAAKIFLSNYQTNPKGERAPDSLYFLGQALVQLNKKPEACKVYDELEDVYGASMRSWVKDRLPRARQDARCD